MQTLSFKPNCLRELRKIQGGELSSKYETLRIWHLRKHSCSIRLCCLKLHCNIVTIHHLIYKACKCSRKLMPLWCLQSLSNMKMMHMKSNSNCSQIQLSSQLEDCMKRIVLFHFQLCMFLLSSRFTFIIFKIEL